MSRVERGQTLAEMLVVVGIMLLVAGAGVGFTIGRQPGSIGTTARQFTAILAQARAVAATSTDGATVVVGPSACPVTTPRAVSGPAQADACIYATRPIGAPLPSQALTTFELPAEVDIPALGSPPYAIFISPSGYVAASTWSTPNAVPSAEPVCAASLTIGFGGGNGASQGVLDCTTASFTYPATAATATAAGS